MAEYEKLSGDSTKWEKLMDKTKEIRERIWSGVSIPEGEEDDS